MLCKLFLGKFVAESPVVGLINVVEFIRATGKKKCGAYAEKKYFDSKGFSYPRKCEICRKNKNSGGNSGSSKSGTKRGGFFGGIFGF